MAMRPDAICSNPAMHRSAVVLPQPLGPSMQPIRPCSERERELVQHAVAVVAVPDRRDFE